MRQQQSSTDTARLAAQIRATLYAIMGLGEVVHATVMLYQGNALWWSHWAVGTVLMAISSVLFRLEERRTP